MQLEGISEIQAIAKYIRFTLLFFTSIDQYPLHFWPLFCFCLIPRKGAHDCIRLVTLFTRGEGSREGTREKPSLEWIFISSDCSVMVLYVYKLGFGSLCDHLASYSVTSNFHPKLETVMC